MIISTTLVQKV